MERQWRQPVACSRNSTARSICAALDGDSRRCQYTYLQLRTIDDAWLRSMTDRYLTGARRRKFWTFQNFRMATAAIGTQWHLVAFAHGCVCALWRSTAFINCLRTADERRQKPPMCDSSLSWLHLWHVQVPVSMQHWQHQGSITATRNINLLFGCLSKPCSERLRHIL